MHMLNPHCGVDRDSRGVVRLTICNAGPLNILNSTVIRDVREGLETLATERAIRALVVAGESEKSMIGGADIKEMAKLKRRFSRKSDWVGCWGEAECRRYQRQTSKWRMF